MKTDGGRDSPCYLAVRNLINKIGVEKCLAKVPVLRNAARLKPWEKKEEAVCRYLYDKLKTILYGVILISVLFLLSLTAGVPQGEINPGRDGFYLIKGEPGEEKTLTVKARMKAGERSDSVRFEISVPARQPGETEKEALFQEAEEYIGSVWLADNRSADEVTGRLFLPDRIPGTGLTVRWEIADPALISYSGTVNNKDLHKEGKVTELTAKIGLGEEERSVSFLVHVLPAELTRFEKAQKELAEKIQEDAGRYPEESTVSLPDSLNGTPIDWETEEGGSRGWYPLLLLAVIFGICAGSAAESSKGMKQRKMQLAADYPDLISRLSLYLGAGMSIRNAWERTVKEYMRRAEGGGKKRGGNRRYAYEEMKLTLNELYLGTSAEEAFERFGKRTGELSYIRLGSLLAQNVRKGNERLTSLMEEEEAASFAGREEEAKKLGEEAETKLLGPMMGILIIVIAIVLIPAFRGMSM